LQLDCSALNMETILQERGLCRAPHKPRYVEFRIMWSQLPC
jgi:hypothetical protein